MRICPNTRRARGFVKRFDPRGSNSHYGDGLPGRARHSVRAVRSQAPQDRRARSDAPYQPDKMRIAALEGLCATGEADAAALQ
jgi:hypothetical protein